MARGRSNCYEPAKKPPVSANNQSKAESRRSICGIAFAITGDRVVNLKFVSETLGESNVSNPHVDACRRRWLFHSLHASRRRFRWRDLDLYCCQAFGPMRKRLSSVVTSRAKHRDFLQGEL